MDMKSSLSERGQITIPKALRDRLGLRTGDIVEFRAEEGRLVGTKVTPEDPVKAVYGILELERSTDEVVTELRGEPDPA